MTLVEIITEICTKRDVRVTALRGPLRGHGISEARHEIWERGNLEGYSDKELARATGVTRQTVGEWLDMPRRTNRGH